MIQFVTLHHNFFTIHKSIISLGKAGNAVIYHLMNCIFKKYYSIFREEIQTYNTGEGHEIDLFCKPHADKSLLSAHIN